MAAPAVHQGLPSLSDLFAQDKREKTVNYESATVPTFAKFAMVGIELSRMQPGDRLRIHQYQRTNTNGDQIHCSPYARDSMLQGVEETARRMGFKIRAQISGVDVLVAAL